MTDINAAAVRDALAGDLAELQRGLEEITVQVEQINVALTGNGLGVSHGLIGCVQKIEAQQEVQVGQISCIENRWQRVKWALIGVALGSGVGGGGIAYGLLRAVGS